MIIPCSITMHRVFTFRFHSPQVLVVLISLDMRIIQTFTPIQNHIATLSLSRTPPVTIIQTFPGKVFISIIPINGPRLISVPHPNFSIILLPQIFLFSSSAVNAIFSPRPNFCISYPIITSTPYVNSISVCIRLVDIFSASGGQM
uniref:Uncharacterized protein n=1 Tax=Arundo donax TaxID=35708 RepID=A0A0A9DJZ4_ARUDO